MAQTPVSQILFLERNRNNDIYIMRDDLLPFSFGGNKVRKALLFFEQIEKGEFDTVVTYGSGGSNHCRIVANMAFARGLACHVISTDADSDCINRKLVQSCEAQLHMCTVDQVAATIDSLLQRLTLEGKKPYFIPGGGHGNLGTRAYDLAYDQILAFSKENNIKFDYIFHASGTGTTQAGLISGKLRCGQDDQKIVGISIARRNPYGGQVVAKSVLEYTGAEPGEALIFTDDYICGGYGKYDQRIHRTVQRMYLQCGVPMDPTYTAKAYTGMEQYLEQNGIRDSKILFIHTGGTPLFCDWVRI